jgi:hypothetical protein
MSELFSFEEQDTEPFELQILNGEFEDFGAAISVLSAYNDFRSEGKSHRESLEYLLEGEEITRKQFNSWLEADLSPGQPSN